MKIIEKKLQSKTNNPEKCEDNIVIDDNFIGVIDGATSKTDYKIDGKTPGRFASQKIEEAISRLNPEATLEETFEFINGYLQKCYKDRDMKDFLINNPRARPTASLALYSVLQGKVWLIGDCKGLINDEVHTNNKEIDEILSQVRSLFLELENLKGISKTKLLKKKKGREYIFPLLKQQFLIRNNTSSQYSYGVLDGFECFIEDVKCLDVEGEEIILASDGYPKLFNTLEQSEKYLKELIENDPLLFEEYKSTKGVYQGYNSFDDRAYIRIQI